MKLGNRAKKNITIMAVIITHALARIFPYIPRDKQEALIKILFA